MSDEVTRPGVGAANLVPPRDRVSGIGIFTDITRTGSLECTPRKRVGPGALSGKRIAKERGAASAIKTHKMIAPALERLETYSPKKDRVKSPTVMMHLTRFCSFLRAAHSHCVLVPRMFVKSANLLCKSKRGRDLGKQKQHKAERRTPRKLGSPTLSNLRWGAGVSKTRRSPQAEWPPLS